MRDGQIVKCYLELIVESLYGGELMLPQMVRLPLRIAFGASRVYRNIIGPSIFVFLRPSTLLPLSELVDFMFD